MILTCSIHSSNNILIIVGNFSFDFVVQDLDENRRRFIDIVTINENLHNIMNKKFPDPWYEVRNKEDINNENIQDVVKACYEWNFTEGNVIRMFVTDNIDKLMYRFTTNLNKLRLHYIDNKIVCRIKSSDLNNILTKHITIKQHYNNLKEFVNAL